MESIFEEKKETGFAFEISSLDKFFGKFQALNNVSLNIPKGKIIGLLGKNGAGKSTLMRCMLGFLHHQGSIKVEGQELEHRDSKIFEKVAFIPDVSGLDDRLTVQQTIDYVAGVNPKWNQETCNKLMAISSLPLNKKVGQLSKGMKTKLFLLVTLSLDVRILLLDEPTLGLDIAFRKEFFNTILGEFFDENKTIIISTHQVEEIEPLLQEIIFIDNGKILLYEDMEQLKDKYRIVTVTNEYKDELIRYNPKLLTKTIGYVSGLLPSDIEIPGATYTRALISDIFLSVVGGSNETV